MSTVTEILSHAMALPPQERATIAQSLIRSLSPGPAEFQNEEQLSLELQRRLSAIESGQVTTLDADTVLQRAREAVKRVRQP
jgi:putative addiction module component (TIGR02574 family)